MNISVILCTYNRAEMLRRALESAAAQTMSSSVKWELVAVDNGSTDDTPNVVAGFVERCPSIRYVREEKQGLSHARNRGIAESTGDVLCFIDDDVRLPPDYVQKVYSAWKNGGWDLAGGRVVADYDAPPPNWIGRLPRQMLNGPFGLHDRGEGDFILEDADDIVPIGANMLIPRTVFNTIGSFNTALGRTGASLRSGEDSELYERARRAGLKVGYCGSCPVRHFVPARRLKRRYFIRWKFSSALAGGNEALPSNTVFWFRVPRYVWREFIRAVVRLPGALFTRRRMESVIVFAGILGQVVGYLTGKRKYLIEGRQERR